MVLNNVLLITYVYIFAVNRYHALGTETKCMSNGPSIKKYAQYNFFVTSYGMFMEEIKLIQENHTDKTDISYLW